MKCMRRECDANKRLPHAVRTLLSKVPRNRRRQRRQDVAQRPPRGGRRLHGQGEQVRFGGGVAAQQVGGHRG